MFSQRPILDRFDSSEVWDLSFKVYVLGLLFLFESKGFVWLDMIFFAFAYYAAVTLNLI